MQKSSPYKINFYIYLALVCWVPIPLASKHVFAQDFFIICTTLLSISCCWRAFYTSPSFIVLKKAQAIILLLCGAALWLIFQTIPLPIEWIVKYTPIRAQYTGLVPLPERMAISFHPWATFHSFLVSAAYIQFFALTLILINSESRLKILLYAIVILGVLQATYGALMTLSGIEKQLWFDKAAHIGFATGTLRNRNHLANYLIYAAASGIGLLLASSRFDSVHTLRQIFRTISQWLLGNKGFLRFSLIIIVTGLILTRSRMGNISFFISLSSTALLWLIISRKFNKRTFYLFASLLIIDFFLVGTWFGIDKVAERIENTNSENELRHQMTPYMLKMANDFWLTGTGAGTFADTFPLYKKQMTTQWYNEAHNDYLQFFIEFGVIGMAPLCLVVLLSLVKTYQTIRYRHSKVLVATGFSVLMALTASGLHATVEYNLQRPATASLFVIFLALPWVTAHMPSAKRKRKASPPTQPS